MFSLRMWMKTSSGTLERLTDRDVERMLTVMGTRVVSGDMGEDVEVMEATSAVM